MNQQATLGAQLHVAGNLEFRDKDGNLLKTVGISGTFPLSDLGMTVEQAQQLIQENSDGTHDRN